MHQLTFDENNENDPITDCDGREAALEDVRLNAEKKAEEELAEHAGREE